MELTLFTDHACNLRCSYCYTGEKRSFPMSQRTAERAIDFALARDKSGLTLSFFGGEPTLHMDLLENATDYASRQLALANPHAKLIVHLNTNATRITSRVIDFIRSYPLVDSFVSLDGPAKVHDRHRLNVHGSGSHSEVVSGILRLHEAGSRIATVSVVTPETAQFLGETALELMSLPLERANVVCNLRANWDPRAISVLRQGLVDMARHWMDRFRAGTVFHLEPFTTHILSHLHGAMPCGARCQFGTKELVVAPSGRFYTCGELVGEDRDLSLCIGDLERGIDENQLLKLREQRSAIELTCEDCPLHTRCSSACGCKHVALTGNLGQITSTLCDTEAAFIVAADEAAEALYAEQCDSFLAFFYRKSWKIAAEPTFVKLRRKTDIILPQS
jgi:uncharacterized protein